MRPKMLWFLPRPVQQALAVVVAVAIVAPSLRAELPQYVPELREADDSYAHGKFDDAVRILQGFLEDPNLSSQEKQEAYRLLALTYISMNELEEARTAVKHLLQIAPDYEPAEPPPFVEMVASVKAEDHRGRGWTRWLLMGAGAVATAVVLGLLSGAEGNGQKANALPEPPDLPEPPQVHRRAPVEYQGPW